MRSNIIIVLEFRKREKSEEKKINKEIKWPRRSYLLATYNILLILNIVLYCCRYPHIAIISSAKTRRRRKSGSLSNIIIDIIYIPTNPPTHSFNNIMRNIRYKTCRRRERRLEHDSTRKTHLNNVGRFIFLFFF